MVFLLWFYLLVCLGIDLCVSMMFEPYCASANGFPFVLFLSVLVHNFGCFECATLILTAPTAAQCKVYLLLFCPLLSE